MFHQFIDGDIRVVDHRQATFNHFSQVVGRNIGGHTHGDTGGAIDQQIGDARWQHHRNLFGLIVVGDKVDGLFFQVFDQRVGDLGHTDFGVSHCRGGVTINRTEVTLAIHQHIAQRERLGHSHNSLVNRRVTVGVVFTDYVTHHTGRFFVGLVPVVAQLVHGEKCAAMYRLETVPDIWQCPTNNHAHGVG